MKEIKSYKDLLAKEKETLEKIEMSSQSIVDNINSVKIFRLFSSVFTNYKSDESDNSKIHNDFKSNIVNSLLDFSYQTISTIFMTEFYTLKNKTLNRLKFTAKYILKLKLDRLYEENRSNIKHYILDFYSKKIQSFFRK